MHHKEEFINQEIGLPYGSFHLNVQRMLSRKPLGLMGFWELIKIMVGKCYVFFLKLIGNRSSDGLER